MAKPPVAEHDMMYLPLHEKRPAAAN